MAKSRFATYFAPIIGAILGGVAAVTSGLDAGPYAAQGGSAVGTLLGVLFNNIALKANAGPADQGNLAHPENKQRGFFTPLMSLFLLAVGIAGLTMSLYLKEGRGENVLLSGGLLLLAVAACAGSIAWNTRVSRDEVDDVLKRANRDVRKGARHAGAH